MHCQSSFPATHAANTAHYGEAVMYLMVRKILNGGHIPFFVESRERSEAALMKVIQEAHVNGVSTRKIEKLTKSVGIDSISRFQVPAKSTSAEN